MFQKEDAAHQHQFILHAALDIVQDLAWTTSAMFLKQVDRFNDLVVSVYVTAGHILHLQVVSYYIGVSWNLTFMSFCNYIKFKCTGLSLSLKFC